MGPRDDGGKLCCGVRCETARDDGGAAPGARHGRRGRDARSRRRAARAMCVVVGAPKAAHVPGRAGRHRMPARPGAGETPDGAALAARSKRARVTRLAADFASPRCGARSAAG
ncbi:hypothetical protein Mro02_29000 [Microbispora rosea subsp. aerata]|nr:hypothetical protein Mro02_29000 [Microbispora rosea subsp. aerata]